MNGEEIRQARSESVKNDVKEINTGLRSGLKRGRRRINVI